VLLVPLTVAVNVWFCDGCRVTEDCVSEVITGAFTVKANCAEFEPHGLVALTVNVKTPVVVGVPLMMPVEDTKLSPAGRVPLVKAQVIGVVPVAVSDCE
jgi:hypothetical protein